jgi:chromate transporter
MSGLTETATHATGPSLGKIADVFARYANFTLGGGSATVAVMHRELLDKRHWINLNDFTALPLLG